MPKNESYRKWIKLRSKETDKSFSLFMTLVSRKYQIGNNLATFLSEERIYRVIMRPCLAKAPERGSKSSFVEILVSRLRYQPSF